MTDPADLKALIAEAADALEMLEAARFQCERGDYCPMELDCAGDWLEDIARQLVALRDPPEVES